MSECTPHLSCLANLLREEQPAVALSMNWAVVNVVEAILLNCAAPFFLAGCVLSYITDRQCAEASAVAVRTQTDPGSVTTGLIGLDIN